MRLISEKIIFSSFSLNLFQARNYINAASTFSNYKLVLLKTPDFITGCDFIEKHRGFDENTGVGVKPDV